MIKVLIVGAGPAGLTTAVELARRGMNLGIADGAELARRMVEGGLAGYGEARHRVGKEIIAGSEAVRKVMTSRNPVTRFLVLAVLKTASFMPALQRQFANKILYG